MSIEKSLLKVLAIKKLELEKLMLSRCSVQGLSPRLTSPCRRGYLQVQGPRSAAEPRVWASLPFIRSVAVNIYKPEIHSWDQGRLLFHFLFTILF